MKRQIVHSLVAILLASTAFVAQATPATSYYVYDESGHIIGEYDANGNPVQEHIYLGDRPVAVAVTNSGSTTVDYVATDQLNTPRAVTDASGTVDWSWTSDPFGNGQPSSSLTYNLRFPGQYYDAETGHDYNYFRDYDSSTGRYIESDPIGLEAGVNTYVYVDDYPLGLSDRLGTDALPVPLPVPPLPLPTPAQAHVAAQAAQLALQWAGMHVHDAGEMVGGYVWDWFHPTLNKCDDSDQQRCREVKNKCIEACSQFGLPSKNGDGVSFRRCVRNCMSRQGCYSF